MRQVSRVGSAVLILGLCVKLAFAQTPATGPATQGPQLDGKKIEAIMSAAYTQLAKSDAWQLPWEKDFDKERQVPAVKALIEKEPDVRWARIVLDDRILGPTKEKDYSWAVGIIWAMSSGANFPFRSHPLGETFDFVPGDDEGRAKLLGSTATLKTIESLYGKPTRVENGQGDARGMIINCYGLVGFMTAEGGVQISGLRMPFVFFKLGYRPLARLTLQR